MATMYRKLARTSVRVFGLMTGLTACAGETSVHEEGIDDVPVAELSQKLEETQCGPSPDFQQVEQYNGSDGVTVDWVTRKQSAVAQIQWKSDLASRYTSAGNVNAARWCSGTMISSDLFLTAGHCLDTNNRDGWVFPRANGTATNITPAVAATELVLNFNYQQDPSGVLRTATVYNVTQLVEHRLGSLDYAILRVAGAPGNVWGVAPISRTNAATNSTLAIIGHPAGQPKQVDVGVTNSVSGNTISYSDIDTLGGNSGSGILERDSGALVGVHTNGGCTTAPNNTASNFGVAIGAIIASSPTLTTLFQEEWAFAWGDQPSTASYTANTTWSRNSLGGNTTVTRNGVGSYTVSFPNVGRSIGGNVLVNAYGSDNVRCNSSGWGSSGTTLNANVSCYTPAGALADSRFVISYRKKGSSRGGYTGAYVWNNLSTSSGITSPTYQWNSTGALNRVTRNSAGSYRVSLPGLGLAAHGGTVQVSGYATTGSCKVANWFPSGTTLDINVNCRNSAGAFADAMFTLSFDTFNAAAGSSAGFAWANDAASAMYTPSTTYSRVSRSNVVQAGTITARRSALGEYSMAYPVLNGGAGTSALVTAYGSGANYCKVRFWGGAPATVNVGCYTTAGALVDTQYVSNFATDQL